MSDIHRFPYEWNIADGYPAKGIEKHGKKVFGTFICGGGSSMGYKLAGYNHLGGVEIDEKVAKIYKTNHHPQYMFNEDLRLFNDRTDLPDELYALDLLDGSPPCSTFSMAGSREGAWGKEKKFAEGQKEQTLDDLVFIYCGTILKLKPKSFLLENVKGLTAGNAKSYLKRIVTKLNEGGYVCQVFVLNAATMGVPQKRERAFVIGHKQEYQLPSLRLKFNEKPIFFRAVLDRNDLTKNLTEREQMHFDNRRPKDRTMSDTRKRIDGKNAGFTRSWVHSNAVCPTLITTDMLLYDYPRKMNEREIRLCSTFPQDYQVPSRERQLWLCGMSVPPVMTANISYEIYKQWLKNID